MGIASIVWPVVSLRARRSKVVTAFWLSDCRTVHVYDREADFYELLRDAASIDEHVLIRATHNRGINKKKRREEPTTWLFDELLNSRAQGRTTERFQVNGRSKFREAKLSIIYKLFALPPPRKRTVNKDGNLPIVVLTVIMIFASFSKISNIFKKPNILPIG